MPLLKHYPSKPRANLGSAQQLEGHVRLAIANGVTRQEIAEVITHPAFYTGWPNAMNAVAATKRALSDEP